MNCHEPYAAWSPEVLNQYGEYGPVGHALLVLV